MGLLCSQDKVSRFVEFFQNVFGEVDIVVDEAESVVKCWWGHGDRAINTTVDYLEHGIRVCREGPWQPASFSLMQVRIPTRPAESGTSRLVLSAGVPHPSDKRLRELSAVYGIVAANVKAASDRVKVAQLWGLHDNVQAALDRLVVGPDKNADQEKISLRLGQRNLEQLASTGWIRTLERRRAKVELYQQRGTIRVTRLHIIAASLVEALPRSVQLVDMVDAAVMRNVAARANLEAFARAGGGVAGDIEVIPVRESWRLLVVAPGEERVEGTCKAIGQAARRWADAHVSVPLNPQMYVKQLHKSRWQRGVEKDSKPPIIADLSRAVSKHGVDLWLDAFCLRGHVGEIAVKKAVEAVLRTKLKKNYPGLLAKRRVPDAPSSTVDGAGPPDLAPPKSRANAWDSGSFSSSGTASFPSRNTTGAPAGAAAGSKTSGQSSAASPARARQAAGTAGHVGVGGGSCGDGVGAFPAFSFGTTASGPPARAWDMETFATAGHGEDLDKVSRFVEFFQNVFGEVDIVVDEAESVVKCWWGRQRYHAIYRIANYLEHGIRVCREGPWQPASFSLMQARIPTHPAESGTSRLVLSAGVPHPSDKRLTELSAVYGIVAATVQANWLKAQPPPPPPPSSGDGADIGLNGVQNQDDGLPQSFAPPSVEAASDRVKVAQLWGLHDSVQAALDRLVAGPEDRLVVGPDKNAYREHISLRLGQRNLEQLASTGWVREVERRGAKVELYLQSGTIRVTRLHIIAASLVERLPRSVQLEWNRSCNELSRICKGVAWPGDAQKRA
ncbi:expressed unknown protein [Ectocarpus siliculosus]|uniref:Uncharacterized protein n=1 Tax=Ectocarpus siliculosus TaxID=2880 RepID=D7G696_ECTSI|nr:expressed unknown protein [Ectocarpus siliculosus]|eukprot:CBJ27491.1 expressed unknown protein [Ectocarpus siliculosus]